MLLTASGGRTLVELLSLTPRSWLNTAGFRPEAAGFRPETAGFRLSAVGLRAETVALSAGCRFVVVGTLLVVLLVLAVAVDVVLLWLVSAPSCEMHVVSKLSLAVVSGVYEAGHAQLSIMHTYAYKQKHHCPVDMHVSV